MSDICLIWSSWEARDAYSLQLRTHTGLFKMQSLAWSYNYSYLKSVFFVCFFVVFLKNVFNKVFLRLGRWVRLMPHNSSKVPSLILLLSVWSFASSPSVHMAFLPPLRNLTLCELAKLNCPKVWMNVCMMHCIPCIPRRYPVFSG